MKILQRVSRCIAALVLLCFLPSATMAGGKPYIPAAVSSVTAGAYIARQVPMIQANMWNAKHISGVFAENYMHNYFNRGLDLASGKRWYSLDPGAV